MTDAPHRLPRRATLLGGAVLAGATLAAPPHATAQDAARYPDRPIRFVIPAPPGGPSDVLLRLIRPHLQDSLGQTVVLDNRPSSGGMVGMGAVARAAPDGYTLVLATSVMVINPSLFRASTYDPIRDFAPIAELATAQAPKVINYLSHGLTAADALDPRTGIPLSAGIPVAGDEYVNADSLGTYGDEPGQVSQAILGELVKSKPEAIVRPDDRADRFTISQAGPERLAASTTDSGFSWNDGATIGVGALVVLVLALALGFGLVRRPKVAV